MSDETPFNSSATTNPRVRNEAGTIAYIAERFAASYYANDDDWERLLAALREAVRELR